MKKIKIIRTLEEKEILINSFLKSNQSMAQWCRDNQIPTTTFNGWMRRRKTKIAFIPLEPAITKKIHVKESQDINLILEFMDCKITINNNSPLDLLEKTLKVVKNLYV